MNQPTPDPLRVSKQTAQNLRAHMAAASPPYKVTDLAAATDSAYSVAARKLRGEQSFTVDDLAAISVWLGVPVPVLTRTTTFPKDWQDDL